MMEIYLIRHTSVDVPAGYAYGQTDVPLKASFPEEAAAVRAQLEGILFDQVWSSPLSRCVRLAVACGYPEARRDDRLKEIGFGAWEMKSWNEISADPRSEAWFADWIRVKTPEGESLTDQYLRVAGFLEEARRSTFRRIAVFAHGGVLTCAKVYAGEYALEDAFKNVPAYGEVIKLALE